MPTTSTPTADGFIVQGDLLPVLRALLKDAANAPINLTGATVECRVKRLGTQAATIVSAASIVDAVNGVVEHEWTVPETQYGGELQIVFVMTRAGGKQTFPAAGPLRIMVKPQL